MKLLRQIKRKFFRSLSVEMEERILKRWFRENTYKGVCVDVGGGTGPYSKYLSPELKIINLNIEKKSETSVVADAHLIPIKEHSVDLIIITNVLEHVRDPVKVIDEISRCLKIGGEMILVVPFLFKVHPDPEDHWRFTWQCLERILQDKYQILELRSSGGRFAVIWEILLQCRVLELLRIFNPLIARLDMESKDYALAYSVRLSRKI